MAGNIVKIGTQATGVAKASSDLDKLRDRFERLQKQGAKGFAIGAGAAITAKGLSMVGDAASAAIDFMNDAVKSASNLNESMTLSAQVFEGNTAAVQDWAAGAADAFGQSQREALDFASNFGTAFKNVGMSLDDTTNKAEAMTRLAADLGSAFNASSDEAATALRSGLLGESEPLRRFGVFLDEAKTKNKALAMGMTATNGVFTDAQKVTARYALIMDQTADSQGMFGRDSNSLADTQKSLGAQMENVTAKIGEDLIPIMLQLATVVEKGVVPAIELLANTVEAATKLVPDLTATTYELAEAEMDVTGKISDQTAAMLMGNEATLLADKAMTTFVSHVGVAADVIAKIPPPVIYSRRELAMLAQAFKDTAAAARANRLDEAYDIAELPLQLAIAKDQVKATQRELDADLTSAERKAITSAIRIGEADVAAGRTRTQAAKDLAKNKAILEGDMTAAQRRESALRLLQGQHEIDTLKGQISDKTDDFKALGHLLGTAYGRALFQAVAAWNRRTSNIPAPNPRYPSSTRNIDLQDQGKAAGGPASGVTLVGEKGPEIVDLPAGSYVHSNAESRGMAASLPAAGGGVTNFNVSLNVSPTGYSPAQAEQIANAVGPAIATYLRRRGLL